MGADRMKNQVRNATSADYGMFSSLWEEFIKERESLGSSVIMSEELLTFYTDIFMRVVQGIVPGLCMIVPNKGVNLWGPELPFPTKYGRTLIAQGTFVRNQFRQHGIAMMLFDAGLVRAKELGFDAVLSSVDVGNDLSFRNAAQRGFEDVQVSKIISTGGE